MQELAVNSRIIEAVFFSQDDGQLYIRFQNGEERRFMGVSQREATALVKSSSPGTHYIKHIRDNFPRVAA